MHPGKAGSVVLSADALPLPARFTLWAWTTQAALRPSDVIVKTLALWWMMSKLKVKRGSGGQQTLLRDAPGTSPHHGERWSKGGQTEQSGVQWGRGEFKAPGVEHLPLQEHFNLCTVVWKSAWRPGIPHGL